MKIDIIKYFAIIAVLFLSFSCDDYLDETNPNQSSSDTYWQNLTHTDGSLTSTYGALQNNYVLNIREEAWRSDMGIPGYGRPSYAGDGVPWYNQQYTNTNIYITRKWESLYLGTYRANQTIEGLQRLEGEVNEEAWRLQMAQARFLRGLFHFYLYSSFNGGEIIIRDKVPSSEDEYYISVSPAADVLEFIRADLTYAYENLPAQYGANTGNQGRVTKGAAAMILGNSYLGENDFESAKEYYEDIIFNKTDNYGYELVDDIDLLFTTAGEFNKESIFEITYDNTVKSEYNAYDEDRMTNRLAAFTYANVNTAFHPTLWLTWEYLTDLMDTKDPRNYKEDGVTLKNVSLRTSSMLAVIQDESHLYYNENVIDAVSLNKKNGYARYRKYSNWDILNNEIESPGGKMNSGKNITVNRLAEAYLNLAECYIELGRSDEAIELINTNRSRWGLSLIGLSGGDSSHDYDEVSYSSDQLMDLLRFKEKPLELSAEGHEIRWIDLRRWGVIKENFEVRSQEIYWTQHYKSSAGAEKTHCTITKIDPEEDGFLEYTDFGQAAVNFDPDIHAWLPIPSTEEVSNANLYKK